MNPICESCKYQSHCYALKLPGEELLHLMDVLHQTSSVNVVAGLMGYEIPRAAEMVHHLEQVWQHCKAAG